MNIPAWQIIGWPAVDLSIDRWAELSGFQPVGHASRLDEEARRLGNTLWSVAIDGHRVGLAWEWLEVHPNVFAMSDPMSIMSNVALIVNGRMTNEFERVLHLNNAVYQLGWQQAIASILRRQDDREVILALAA